MSMTLEELRQWFAEWMEDYYDELHTEDDLTPEAAESVLVALRAPTREQVEKMRGEWTFLESSRTQTTLAVSAPSAAASKRRLQGIGSARPAEGQ